MAKKKARKSSPQEGQAQDKNPVPRSSSLGVKPITKKEILALAKQIGAVVDPGGVLGEVKYYLPTGCSALDAILGGGWAIGRIHEVLGDYSTGKSTILEHAVASAQKYGASALLISSEASIDLSRMKRIGCNVDDIMWVETDSLEEGFKSVKRALEGIPSDRLLLIGWDTIGACHPSDDRPGAGAKEVREALRYIPLLIAQKQACFIIVNQTAIDFNMFSTEPANPRGGGIRFHATTRTLLRGRKRISANGEVLGESASSSIGSGIRTVAQVIKNKKFPPYRRAYLPVMFETGIDDALSLWYFFDGSPVFKRNQGWVYIDYGNGSLSKPFQLSTWKSFLYETEGLLEWLRQKALSLAYEGYDPTK